MSSVWNYSWARKAARYMFIWNIRKTNYGHARNADSSACFMTTKRSGVGDIWIPANIRRSYMRRRRGATVPNTDLEW